MATTHERLADLGPLFRAGDAIALGLSWRDLYQLRDEGEVLEVSRGVYQVASAAGGPDIDFAVVSLRAPEGMICLDSALSYWDLSDEIPRAVHVAVPQGNHRPSIDHPPTIVHVFSRATFSIGRVEVAHDSGERFSITDPTRSVIDSFRFRQQLGADVAHAALRRHLAAGGKPGQIADMARLLRVKTPVMTALRVLGA
jgi:predicted transcriptional regulator of viral defense system